MYGKAPNVSSNCRVIGYWVVLNFLPPVEAPPNQEFVTQNTVQQTDQNLHVKGAQSVASWSLVLAGLVVGVTVCVAIGYIVFLQPNPDLNVPNLPPSDGMVETPPDETSSTSSPSQTR
jgi:ABC-type nitrate/sulfonate/bicarbonate transport system permease component